MPDGTLEEWRHRYRVAEAEAAHYRRLVQEYEWALRQIRNSHGLAADDLRAIAAHVLTVAGEAD